MKLETDEVIVITIILGYNDMKCWPIWFSKFWWALDGQNNEFIENANKELLKYGGTAKWLVCLQVNKIEIKFDSEKDYLMFILKWI
jgi:hypothetical protein